MGIIRPSWLEGLWPHHPLMFENQFKDLFDRVATKQDHQFNTLIDRLDTIISLLNNMITKEISIMATIQDLANAVNAESTVDDSIITLLDGIVAQLQAVIASGDPASLDAVVSAIQANTAKIQAAVTANTPAAPVTPVTP